VLCGPMRPGSYRLALALVDEQRFWLAELGNFTPKLDVEVAPRDAMAARAFLPPRADLDPDWEERVYVAHTEGYAAVGGSIDWISGPLRSPPDGREPYARGRGRNPPFVEPVDCPSLLPAPEPNAKAAGITAA